MSRRIVWLIVLLVVIGAAAIAFMKRSDTPIASTQPTLTPTNPHEQLMADMIDFSNRVTAIVASANDDASAKAALPKLKAAVLEIRELRHRMDKLGPPDPAVKAAMEQKYGETLKSSNDKSFVQDQRVRNNPKLESILGRSLDAMTTVATATPTKEAAAGSAPTAPTLR